MPKRSARPENLTVAYIITAGSQTKKQTITQFINKTDMRENKIKRGGIGIESRSVLSFARKSMLYAINALKAMLASKAIKPNIKKYIHPKPGKTRPSNMPAAHAHIPKNNSTNKSPNKITFVAMLLPVLRFFFLLDFERDAPKNRIANNS